MHETTYICSDRIDYGIVAFIVDHTFGKNMLKYLNWYLNKHVLKKQVIRYVMYLVIIVYSKQLKETIMN